MDETLTRAESDRLYRAIDAVIDPAAKMEDFAARSRRFRATARSHLDVAYGRHVDERLDIFLPADDAAPPWPVHIFIHGGYWYQFGKDEWSFIADALTAAGAMVIVPRYSLCPAVGIGEIVQQMRTMMCWVHGEIAALGGDPGRILVSGHSAGGHLATELLLTDWARDYGLPANVLKGVLSISGLYDLRPIRTSYVQEQVGLSEQEARRLSPLLHASGIDTQVMLAVAEDDPEGFHLQARDFEAAWRADGYAIARLTLARTDHLSILESLGQPGGRLAIEALGQIAGAGVAQHHGAECVR